MANDFTPYQVHSGFLNQNAIAQHNGMGNKIQDTLGSLLLAPTTISCPEQ